MSRDTDERATPDGLFKLLDAIFQFDVDVAASDSNHKCAMYFTKENDGLACGWTGFNSVFCNPPYSHGQAIKWIKKAEIERRNGVKIVMVLRGDPSTKWLQYAERVGPLYFCLGRFKFGDYQQGSKFVGTILLLVNWTGAEMLALGATVAGFIHFNIKAMVATREMFNVESDG